MTGPLRVLNLADMDGMPMSAGWYWYLVHLRGVLSQLQQMHLAALGSTKKRDPRSLTPAMVAQRDTTHAISMIDRYLRTMEAAGVLSTNA